MFEQEAARPFDLATEKTGGDKGHRHDLGRRHFRLRIIFVFHSLEQVVTQTVDSKYGILHFVLPIEELVARQSGEYPHSA